MKILVYSPKSEWSGGVRFVKESEKDKFITKDWRYVSTFDEWIEDVKKEVKEDDYSDYSWIE